MDIIEFTKNDYGITYTLTLYQSSADTTVENLTTASSVSLDILNIDETPIVNDATVTISDAASGQIQFTPQNTWFTDATTQGNRYFTAIFNINYAAGQKKTLKAPVYIHDY